MGVLGGGLHTFFLASSLSGEGTGSMRLQASGQAARQCRNVAAQAVALQLQLAKVDGAVLVVDAHLQPQAMASEKAQRGGITVKFIEDVLWHSICQSCKNTPECSNAAFQ